MWMVQGAWGCGVPTWTEGAWGVNAGVEGANAGVEGANAGVGGANGATHGVSVGIDGPGGMRPMHMRTSHVNSR